MAKFKFKFENIKRVKDMVQKKLQKELVLLENKIRAKKVEIDDAAEERHSTRLDVSVHRSVKVMDIHINEKMLRYLDERISILEGELSELEQEKTKRIAELTEKNKEVKMYEVLEDRHREQFIDKEKREEQRQLDETATLKFVRKERT